MSTNSFSQCSEISSLASITITGNGVSYFLNLHNQSIFFKICLKVFLPFLNAKGTRASLGNVEAPYLLQKTPRDHQNFPLLPDTRIPVHIYIQKHINKFALYIYICYCAKLTIVHHQLFESAGILMLVISLMEAQVSKSTPLFLP